MLGRVKLPVAHTAAETSNKAGAHRYQTVRPGQTREETNRKRP